MESIAPLVKNTESLGKKIFTSNDIFSTTVEKNKEKLNKKRKVNGNNLQVEKGRTESDRILCKNRRVLIRKIKSSKKGGVSVICELKKFN